MLALFSGTVAPLHGAYFGNETVDSSHRVFACGDPNAFPAGDLGVRKALSHSTRLITQEECVARAETWRPWRAYATLVLWRSLE